MDLLRWQVDSLAAAGSAIEDLQNKDSGNIAHELRNEVLAGSEQA